MKDYPPRAARREPQIARPSAARRLSRQTAACGVGGPVFQNGPFGESSEHAVFKNKLTNLD